MVYVRSERSILHYLLAVTIGLAAVGVYAMGVAGIRYPYTPDSAMYIEVARHLLIGDGLVGNSDLGDTAPTSPLALFPPGFPLLLAAMASLGDIPPATAAVAVSWMSWALLPVALLFALTPLMERRDVHILSLLVVMSPGLAETGWLGLSDTSFLLLVILSFGLLVRGSLTSGRAAALAFLGSGLLCGLAYLLRNSATALLVATVAAVGFLALVRVSSIPTAILRLAWWGIGTMVVLLPLWIRNIAVFGTLQPYRMPPSDIGLVTNTRAFLQALLLDLSALPTVAMLAWDGLKLVVVLLIALIAVWRLLPMLKTAWSDASATLKLGVTLLAAYVVAGSCMVILARSLYQWGEAINLRHVIQYSWAVFALLGVALSSLRCRWLRVVAIAAAFVLAGARWTYNGAQIDKERDTYMTVAEAGAVEATAGQPNRGVMFTNKMKLLAARDRELMEEIRALPEATIVVSNFADVLRIETGRVVYSGSLGLDCDPQVMMDELMARAGAGAHLRVFVFPGNEIVRSGCWARLSTGPARQATPNRDGCRVLVFSSGSTPRHEKNADNDQNRPDQTSGAECFA